MNISRSIGVFDPHKYGGDIHVIGAGATGGRVVEGLIRLGIEGRQITVYDFDKIEEHNIPNQVFSLSQIGEYKTEALKRMIADKYDEEINIVTDKATSKTPMSGIVFLLPDTFEARGDIFKGLEFNVGIKLVVETRIDAYMGYIHTINPMEDTQVKYFKGTLYSDSEATVSACGTPQTIAQTVDMISGVALWEFVKFVNQGKVGSKITMMVQPSYRVFEEDINKICQD